MTEFAGVGTHSSITSHREGSSGTLYPNVELKVKCLETDVDLPPNKPGELLFRGPTMMKGYFNNPKATHETFTNDGFLRTGDIGYIDDDGFVFIVDRLKELIKYKGHQVAPAEVEDIVNSHPQVVDSGCVRGYDLATGEEIPKVYVVLEDGSSLSADDLMEYVARKVTGYKRVREVEFVDSIPKSLSGKILRRVLQTQENEKIKASRSRCVRGYDLATGEEIPKVYVVLEDGSSLSADDLMEYVARKVTGYKRVREVEFVDSIPKSLSGKILRRVLQTQENEKIKASRSRL
ncbi:4-coumarate-CoA ligase [Phytophthora palmivora]|uniref:4-coumarate-CoA ligase n=1 Tax=Phytophthora palmivora TaxID=4796 RepID=A0A2P4YT08_9STRA|nr:4-coumarate-CoA ligase [Phytophthora palmivora]